MYYVQYRFLYLILTRPHINSVCVQLGELLFIERMRSMYEYEYMVAFQGQNMYMNINLFFRFAAELTREHCRPFITHSYTFVPLQFINKFKVDIVMNFKKDRQTSSKRQVYFSLFSNTISCSPPPPPTPREIIFSPFLLIKLNITAVQLFFSSMRSISSSDGAFNTTNV